MNGPVRIIVPSKFKKKVKKKKLTLEQARYITEIRMTAELLKRV